MYDETRSPLFWSGENIFFFSQDTRTPCQAYLNVASPSLDFSTSNNLTENLHPSPHLLELGIVLLELELGLPIELYAGDTSQITDYDYRLAVAWKVFKERNANFESQNYKNAMRFCLKPHSVDSEGDPTMIREAVFQHVFQPLCQELLGLKAVNEWHDLSSISEDFDIRIYERAASTESSLCDTDNWPEASIMMPKSTLNFDLEDFNSNQGVFAGNAESNVSPDL